MRNYKNNNLTYKVSTCFIIYSLLTIFLAFFFFFYIENFGIYNLNIQKHKILQSFRLGNVHELIFKEINYNIKIS